MLDVSRAIKEGAYAYLKKQYQIISIIGLAVSGLLGYLFGFHSALGFLIGAVLSSISGILGMMISVEANVLTTQSAIDGCNMGNHKTGLSHAFHTAIRAGGMIGFLIKGFGILGLNLILMSTSGSDIHTIMQGCLGFCLGASLISIFGRLGGGIFTKAADIGADLVGKVETGIPEDDPRNPAVIADNVGDNVGDCAGMAADVFETYAVSIIAAIQVSFITFGIEAFKVMIPYIFSILSIVALSSLIVVTTTVLKNSIIKTLYGILTRTIILSSILIALWTFLSMDLSNSFTAINPISKHSFEFGALSLYICVLVGFVITVLLMLLTDYYTSQEYKHVKSIAKASETGHATNVIYGLAVGMESTTLPVLVICAAIALCYQLAGIVGIGVSVTSMISLTGVIMTLDAYGPITDNAGGIAEMSHLPKEIRGITDELDAVGNTTKAVTKGYAIGSAALASLVLFFTFVSDIKMLDSNGFSLLNPYILIGLFIGGSLPYSFGSIAMRAVGRIGGLVVVAVREQFAKNPGILDGTSRPDYAQTIRTITTYSLEAMIVPALLPILMPILMSLAIYFINPSEILFALGGMMIGVLVTGVFLALMMTNSGGAWDNSKKYIESGEHGGKGSGSHHAAVTGDTIGDPCKDTVGPAINPMIKIVSIVALLIATFLMV